MESARALSIVSSDRVFFGCVRHNRGLQQPPFSSSSLLRRTSVSGHPDTLALCTQWGKRDTRTFVREVSHCSSWKDDDGWTLITLVSNSGQSCCLGIFKLLVYIVYVCILSVWIYPTPKVEIFVFGKQSILRERLIRLKIMVIFDCMCCFNTNGTSDMQWSCHQWCYNGIC